MRATAWLARRSRRAEAGLARRPRFAPAVAACLFLADQASKLWLEEALAARPGVVLIPGVLSLTPLANPGVFFGLWRVPRLEVFALLVSAAVLLLTTGYRAARGRFGALSAREELAFGLIWGGMLGNLADRLLLGHVFDFVRLWLIPVFNLADTALTFGTAIFIWGILFPGRPVPAAGRPGAPSD